jgi:hypothetical protein
MPDENQKQEHDDVDGCDVEITEDDATSDEELPASEGGVQE